MADQTPFTETEVLLAVMNDDYDRALKLRDAMLDNERRTFTMQADRLARFMRTGLLEPERGANGELLARLRSDPMGRAGLAAIHRAALGET